MQVRACRVSTTCQLVKNVNAEPTESEALALGSKMHIHQASGWRQAVCRVPQEDI